MIAAVQLKQNVISACIFCNIICKFSHWQEPCLVILFEVNKSSKKDFYSVVLLHYLAVNLKVKSGEKLLLNSKKITK